MKIVFDLDGTLANIEHRLHFINGPKKDWPAFFRACVHDVPIPPLVQLCQQLILAGNRVEIWSGRSDMVYAETVAWLSRHLNRHAIGYAALRMRKDGDYRADQIVKAEWLEAMSHNEWPDLVFDDRKRVVDMWRAHGIKCCQVEPGEF